MLGKGRLLISDCMQSFLLTKWLIFCIKSKMYECLNDEDFSFLLIHVLMFPNFSRRLKLCLSDFAIKWNIQKKCNPLVLQNAFLSPN